MTRQRLAVVLLSLLFLALVLMLPRRGEAADVVDGRGAVAETGRELAATCKGCHRPDLRGGPALSPGQPAVPDITAAARRWTEGQFMQALRTGKTPSGYQLRDEVMPWKMTADYSTTELRLLYGYLRSL